MASGYDYAGRLLNCILCNGARTDYTYDYDNCLTGLKNISADGDYQEFLNMVFFMVFALVPTNNPLILNDKKCPFTIEWE